MLRPSTRPVSVLLVRGLAIALMALSQTSCAQAQDPHDADAANVWVEFHAIHSPDAEIVIRDDGHGMALDDLMERWMQPAASLKATVQGRTYKLEEPFHVFATQNPIELEGTYPLPEAQLDRFMFNILIDHLPEEQELEVVKNTTAIQEPEFQHAVDGPTLIAYQRLVRKVPISDYVARYALTLVRQTRPKEPGAAEFIVKSVSYGASVRAAQYLVLGGKARALMRGRYHVTIDDIKALAHPVLRHRILTNFYAESEGVTGDHLVDRLLETVTPPASNL